MYLFIIKRFEHVFGYTAPLIYEKLFFIMSIACVLSGCALSQKMQHREAKRCWRAQTVFQRHYRR